MQVLAVRGQGDEGLGSGHAAEARFRNARHVVQAQAQTRSPGPSCSGAGRRATEKVTNHDACLDV